MSKKPAMSYFYKGSVERCRIRKGKPVYVWLDAYSLNDNTQPWVTYREAQAHAKSCGHRARFVY